MPMMGGEATTARALAETAAGSDLAAIKTTAKKVEDGWVPNGSKHFISNAPYADFLQVLARVEGDEAAYSMFLVDREAFRLGSIQHTMGGDDMQAEVVFDESFVPDGCLIGEPGKAFQYAVEFLG